MFENLTDKLERSFKILKGEGRITEINVAETLKEIRRALIDADVNYKVAKTFTDEVKQKALGQDVLKAVKPGQMMTKIVRDELAELMGGTATDIRLEGTPAVILIAGLQGSGKTTFSGKLASLLKSKKGRQVLLVAGGGSVKKNGAYDAVAASLKEAGLPWCELWGVQANPRSGKVYEGIDLARTEGVDFLLAIGGGSVIDTAKAIGMGVPYDGDFWDFFTGKAKIEHTLPIGTVLTISAAGSEGSDSCVITQEDGNLKWGCPKTDLIRPKFSVLDPIYTYSLPDYQLACGAVDMLAHLCERYFTNTLDVALTDRLCEAVMKTIVDAAPKALADHSDYASHADLMWAGMLAHNNSCGIGRDQDWASHQIEHELSAFYDCAHGAGLAVVMPAWMEYVCGHDVMRFARFAVNVFGCEMDFAHPERTAQAGIRRLRDFFRTLGMPATLEEVGGRAEDIPAMVAHRCEKPNGFPFGGFVKVQEADMEAILRRCAN